MSLKSVLRRTLAVLEAMAALLFLAGLVFAAVLYFSGKLSRAHVEASWEIMRGEKVAMNQGDCDRLAELDRQAATRSSVEQAESEGAGKARAEIEQRRAQLDAEFKKEFEFLNLFNKQLEARERKLSADARQLTDDQKKLADAQKSFQYQKDNTNLRKVLKLYAGMDAETIAADFEERLRGKTSNSPEFAEVVEILRRMPERQASEVLAAMGSPSPVRNLLMQELKKS